jgi:hypothetical protein
MKMPISMAAQSTAQGGLPGCGEPQPGPEELPAHRATLWKVLIKVLDGCAVKGRVQMFAVLATDLGHAIRVEDTATGEARNTPNHRKLLSLHRPTIGQCVLRYKRWILPHRSRPAARQWVATESIRESRTENRG